MKIVFIIVFATANLSLQAQKNIQTVKLGTQEWTAKNLNVVTFRNGDTIPEMKSESDWQKAWEEGKPAWCYYNNESKNSQKYGKLYNWFAVNDQRGLAPKGYHIPTDLEWSRLLSYLGGVKIAGRKMKVTNKNSFSSIPCGLRSGNGGFKFVNENAYWWSSTDEGYYSAIYYFLYYSNNVISSYRSQKGFGLSVRCVKD
jgi:uncharacterized protein (TIGR02145 family)